MPFICFVQRLLLTPLWLGVGCLLADQASAEPLPGNRASGSSPPASVLMIDAVQVASLSFNQPSGQLAIEPDFQWEARPQQMTEIAARFEENTELIGAAPWPEVSGPNLFSQPTVADLGNVDVALSTDFVTEAAPLALPPHFLGHEPSPMREADEEPALVGQAVTTGDEIPWRFMLEPYLYLPFSTSGDITVRNTTVPYNFDLGEVLESLTFAFYGRFEAWKGPWALVLDSYYFNTVESDSTQVTPPPALLGQLPPQVRIDGRAETGFFKIDVAGAYRFGDGNLENAFSTAETEFDLGPFVFDAIAGLRLYSFSNDIRLTSDIGLSQGFGASNTFIEPMIGGRARWNFSDNLAAIAAANISGFGIGTDISVEGYAGVDWLFSGNTSLTATYRLTYIDYSAGSSGFNLFQHGPTLGVKFRF